MAFYVYVPFDILPIIGFRNDFAIEGGSGMRHLECLYLISFFFPLRSSTGVRQEIRQDAWRYLCYCTRCMCRRLSNLQFQIYFTGVS